MIRWASDHQLESAPTAHAQEDSREQSPPRNRRSGCDAREALRDIPKDGCEGD